MTFVIWSESLPPLATNRESDQASRMLIAMPFQRLRTPLRNVPPVPRRHTPPLPSAGIVPSWAGPIIVKLAKTGIEYGVLAPVEDKVQPLTAGSQPSPSNPRGSEENTPAPVCGVDLMVWSAIRNWLRPTYPSVQSKWSSPDS